MTRGWLMRQVGPAPARQGRGGPDHRAMRLIRDQALSYSICCAVHGVVVHDDEMETKPAAHAPCGYAPRRMIRPSALQRTALTNDPIPTRLDARTCEE